MDAEHAIPKKQSLFGIVEDFDALLDLIEEKGDGDPDADAMIKEFMQELVTNLKTKGDSYARVVTEANASAKTLGEEIDRLRALKQREEAKATRLKAMLMMALMHLKVDKLSTPLHKFAIQNNGGVLPVHVDCDVMELPEHFRKCTWTPDTEVIREALVAGDKIPGTALSERGQHLRIR